MNDDILRVISLFSGIGSDRMALLMAGIPHKIIAVSEVDKHALASYQAIYGDCPNLGDIRQIQRLPDCDLITWSFPCTDLNIAGKRAGMKRGTKSGLVWEVLRLLETAEAKPQWLLMENVQQVLTAPEWPEILERLEKIGYRNKWRKLDSSGFGSAQKRIRVFMISKFGEEPPELPTEAYCKLRLTDCLNPVDSDYVFRIPLKDVVWRKKTDSDGIIVLADWNRPKRLEMWNRIYSDSGLSPAMVCHTGGNRDIKILAGSDSEFLTVRYLTPGETWRLMGFPDCAFKRASQVCSETQLYNQSGNAIVVSVLIAIFKTVFGW